MKTPLKFCALLIAFAAAGTAAAQAYPQKPITMIVPFAAGGPTDTVGRTVAMAMQKRLRQSVVVENVAGAGGTVGAARVANAAPDGYTILLYHVGMATAPSLYPNLSFDPQRSFEPIGEVTDVPMTLIGRPDLQAKDLGELLEYLKRNKVSYAHAGFGSASHLCGMLFMKSIGMDLKTISHKGTGPAMHELLGSRVDLMCDQTTNTTSQIRGGKVIAYGITTSKRISSLPDVPSLHDAGLQEFEVAVWHALYAPAGTPKEALDKLNDALRYALTDTAVNARFNDLGTDPVSLDKATPGYLRMHLDEQLKKWAPIIDKARKYAD